MKTLCLDEVDSFLANLPHAGIDECRRIFTTHRLERFWDSGTLSPYSEEYKQTQLSAYAKIANRVYSTEHESNGQSYTERPEREFLIPFPYGEGSVGSVCDLLITISRVFHIIKDRNVKNVIEFGAGHGHLTLELAKVGLNVTAVDISSFAMDSLRKRAELLNVPLECHVGGFLDFPIPEDGISVAIFKSSFHHCLEHGALLKQIHDALSEDGIVIFCDEPISIHNEVPWGPRLDFESVWAMRSFGWLELGFKEDYFYGLARQNGFRVRRIDFVETKAESIYVASKRAPGDSSDDAPPTPVPNPELTGRPTIARRIARVRKWIRTRLKRS